MEKAFLQDILEQNKMTSSYSFDRVSNENAGFRLNNQAASIGFIYRHIGETMNLFTTFLGLKSDVQNTTMGRTDTGQGNDIEQSRELIKKGFDLLGHLIEITSDEDWLDRVDTPFFGKVTRVRLFSHILFHNSHHAGQISLILAKGGIVS
jgi:uncharacterized damage-inducible protein DinB